MAEIFNDFSLDGDDSLLNSLDAGAATGEVETTGDGDAGGQQQPTDTLENELQDFTLDGSETITAQTSETTTEAQTGEGTESTTEGSSMESEKSPADGEIQTSSLYAPLASALKEQGILSDSFDMAAFEAEGADGSKVLMDAIQGQVTEGIESFVHSLPEKFKQQLLAFNQGVDYDTYVQTQSKRLNLENITEDKITSDVNLQKQILKQNLTAKGFSEEKASKYIENWESLNELEGEAKDALVEEQARAKAEEERLAQEAEAQRQAAAEAQQQTIAQMTDTVNSTEEIIPGKKLNKISRDKILNSMTQVVGKDQHGNPQNAVMATRAKNPIDFEMKLHYLHSLGVFDGDWSSIVKTAKTNAINKLDEQLKAAYSFQGGQQAGPGSKTEDGGSVLDAL